MLKICFMRHGEAEDDVLDCYGGIADFELTDKGRKQATIVSEELKKYKPKLIFSSPLKRAKETAEIIGRELNIDVKVIETLHERNSYGVLSGLNKQEAKRIFPKVFASLKEKPGYSDEPIPGYEEWSLFVNRVHETLRLIISHALKIDVPVVGVVTHGKFTKAAFENVLKISQDYDLKLSALNVIEHHPSKSRIIDKPDLE
jgi:broad specificity phosphatase PhoE